MDQRVGDDWSHRLRRFVQRIRILDRDNNRYVEKVVDPETGEVLRDVEEPLSDHRGHGSAKQPSSDAPQTSPIKSDPQEKLR
ncbi:PepSY domain-containing protein [bacterium]|nr:PepSY domain-containing protein [bacterium]